MLICLTDKKFVKLIFMFKGDKQKEKHNINHFQTILIHFRRILKRVYEYLFLKKMNYKPSLKID